MNEAGIFENKDILVMPNTFMGDYLNLDTFITDINKTSLDSINQSNLYIIIGPKRMIPEKIGAQLIIEDNGCMLGFYKVII